MSHRFFSPQNAAPSVRVMIFRGLCAACTLLLAAPALASSAEQSIAAQSIEQRGPMQVGEAIDMAFASPRVLPPFDESIGDTPTAEPVWRDEIHVPNATYVAPYFSRLELTDGDYVIVRSPDGSRSWRYAGLGKGDLGIKGGFWGIHIPGDTAIVELHSAMRDGRFGYEIDRVARGYTHDELTARYGMHFPDELMPTKDDADTESICGADDSREARCFGSTTYTRARPVARLLINGTGRCTGWLLGNQGHVMTNEHCIGSATTASNTDFEFMAEGSSCSVNCRTNGACAGTVVATSSTLVQLDVNLDYALVQLPTNPTGAYGFLQLRQSGAVNGERIFIPQHPAGWGKRIALHSTHPQNPSGFAEVDSISAPRCGGTGSDIAYYADTQGGSSGSPVLAFSDNRVIALHHCRGDLACTSSGGDGNRGVPIQHIIADLGGNLPTFALGGCPWPVGHEHYCRDCGLCGDGEGDCDTVGECAGGLRCNSNVGANYGWASWIDVCESPPDPQCLNDCLNSFNRCQNETCGIGVDPNMCDDFCFVEYDECRARC